MLTVLLKKHKNTLLNLLWRALQTAGRNGFSFVVFYLSSLFLEKDTFGYYNYILKIAFFLTLFVDFGISMAVSKFTASYDFEKKELIRPMVGQSVVWLLIAALLVGVIGFILNATLFGERYNDLFYLTPLLFTVPLTSLFDSVFRGMKRFKELSIIVILSGGFSAIFFFFLIRYFGLKGAFYAQNLFYLCMLGGLWWYYGKVPLRYSLKLKNEVFSYALIIGVIGIFMFLSTQVDVVFLGYFGYYTEVAYYEIIFRILTLLLMPYAIIGHVLSPDFTRLYTSNQFSLVKKKLRTAIAGSLITSILICTVLYFVLPSVFEIFFTKYNTTEMHKMSNIMLILFFSSLFNGFIALIAIATGHARWGMYFITGVGIMNVALDYVSLVNWGVWGLIYSTVILKTVANVSFIAYYYFKLPSDKAPDLN